jgi:lipooligosaccharide transport system permease protein
MTPESFPTGPPDATADRLSLFAAPRFSLRFVPLWRRHFLVWRKYLFERVLSNIVEPLMTLVAFGYGLGALLPNIDGVQYLPFLATGTICVSVMYSAKFESLWGAYSRMEVQKTWAGVMNTPLSVDDILFGELVWAASKSLFTGICMLLIIWALGIARTSGSLLTLPVLFFAGLSFSSMALTVNALARGWDSLSTYFTVVVTPMVFLSGVFFPLSRLPDWLQAISAWLPLTATVQIVRPMMLSLPMQNAGRCALLLVAYTVIGYAVALVLTRRRLLK